MKTVTVKRAEGKKFLYVIAFWHYDILVKTDTLPAHPMMIAITEWVNSKERS